MNKTLARPTHCYGSEAWTLRKGVESKISSSEMNFMRYTTGYIKWDYKRNGDVLKELNLEPVIIYMHEYQNKWMNRLRRMSRPIDRFLKPRFVIFQQGRDLWAVQGSDGYKIRQ